MLTLEHCQYLFLPFTAFTIYFSFFYFSAVYDTVRVPLSFCFCLDWLNESKNTNAHTQKELKVAQSWFPAEYYSTELLCNFSNDASDIPPPQNQDVFAFTRLSVCMCASVCTLLCLYVYVFVSNNECLAV